MTLRSFIRCYLLTLPPSSRRDDGGSEGGWRALALCLVAVLLAGLASGRVAAQTYRFAVPTMTLQAYVRPDGAVRLVYDITFENERFASPIDVVDIGAPNGNFSYSEITASLDGRPQTAVTSSPYVDPGFAVYLDNPIPPGGRGTLHVEFPVRGLLYEDVTRRGYVSLRLTPTWFGEEFVTGTTLLQIAIHTLPGIQPDEVLYQTVPFTEKALFQERAVVIWETVSHRATGPYLVGASFPDRGLTGGIIRQTVIDLAARWLEDNSEVRFFLGVIVVAAFAIAFFRFSGGTGFSVFAVLGGLLIFLMVTSTYWHLFLIPAMVALLIVVEVSLGRRKRQYLPAVAQVEGGGIKRGLTAPEAAVLLELPLSRVLGLVIFGLLKKGVLAQTQATPLTVEVDEAFRPAGDRKERRAARLQAAQSRGIVLHEYEHHFIDVIQEAPRRALSTLDFSQAMKPLIAGVADRMQGFDLSDTQDYYRQIVRRALAEAKAVGDVATREQVIDRNMEWMMMDPAYPTVFNTPTYRYRPIWMRPIILPGAGKASSAPSSSSGGRTSFGDVAAGFAGWAEATMGGLASAISPGSLQVPGASGGFVNLSGADKVTGDVFKALASSSSSGGRRGGGGGRSCACACAGCACACACAGGGR